MTTGEVRFRSEVSAPFLPNIPAVFRNFRGDGLILSKPSLASSITSRQTLYPRNFFKKYDVSEGGGEFFRQNF